MLCFTFRHRINWGICLLVLVVGLGLGELADLGVKIVEERVM